MHWRAHSDRMTDFAVYDGPGGVLAAVRDELSERVDAARAAGVPDERIVLDPGLGFAKKPEHNWRLLAGIPVLQSLGFRVLVGASRKSFLGTLLADADGEPRPVDDREDATTALTVLLAQQRVWGAAGARRTREPRRPAHLRPLGGRADGGRALRDARPSGRALGHRDRVLRPPRGLRAREARGTGLRHRPASWASTPAPAAASDDLHDTVDYGSLVAHVKAAVESDPVDLIETLAQRISDVCLLDDRVEWARVTVHKPGAPIDATFADVTLTITRPITDRSRSQ